MATPGEPTNSIPINAHTNPWAIHGHARPRPALSTRVEAGARTIDLEHRIILHEEMPSVSRWPDRASSPYSEVSPRMTAPEAIWLDAPGSKRMISIGIFSPSASSA